MNENPEGTGGTPNPLDETPTPPMEPAESEQPVVPVEQPAEPAESVEQPVESAETVEQPVEAETPVEPVAEEPVVEEVTVAEQVVEEPVASVEAAEFESKDSVVEPKKKSKSKAALILAILLLLIAIGCGVAAFLMFNPFGGNSNAVPAAINKLLAGAPKNVNIDGTVTLSDDSETSSAKELVINFQTNMNTETGENATNATLTATLSNDDEIEFEANEIHTQDNKLFVKLSGIGKAITEHGKLLPIEPTGGCDPEASEDCVIETVEDVDYAEGMTLEDKCISEDSSVKCEESITGPTIIDYLGVLETIDEMWVLIPNSDFNNLSSITEINAETQCMINIANNSSDYGREVVDIYKANPFISSSTEKIPVAKKKNTIYKLTIDEEKLAGFTNAMGNSSLLSEFNACIGETVTDEPVTPSNIAAIIKLLPTLYVEIDNDNNFTRAYTKILGSDDGVSVTVDLSFSYPTTSVEIEEPTDYIDINEAFNGVLNSFYSINILDYTTE